MKKIIILIICLITALSITSCVSHTHEFVNEWKTDATHHWKYCKGDDCGEITAKAEHSFGEPVVTAATESAEGKKVYTCSVCGYEKTEKIDKLPAHTCDFSDEWTSNENYHWHACEIEGCTKTEGKAEHTFGESVVTKEPTSDEEGVSQSVCSVCDKTKIDSIEKLPPKMSEEDWILAFAFENLRIDCKAEMGMIGSIESVMLVDGELLHCDPDTDGAYYTDRSALVELDFSLYYSEFNHIGSGVYVADTVTVVSDDLAELELINVVITFNGDGVISTIAYDMVTIGIECKIEYTLSMWGEIEIEYTAPTLSADDLIAALDADNYANVTVDISKYDEEFTYYDYMTVYFDGSEYLSVTVTDDDYVTEEGAMSAVEYNADLFLMLASLDAEKFTYSLDMEMFSYTEQIQFGTETASELNLAIEDGAVVAVYFVLEDGTCVNYDLYDFGSTDITTIES